MAEADSPFDAILHELSGPIQRVVTEPLELSETTLPLLNSLHERDALPALLFNYSRYDCEVIGRAVLSQLENAEDLYKTEDKDYKRKVKEKEELEKAEGKAKTTKSIPRKAKRSKNGRDGDDNDNDEPLSRSQIQRDAASTELNPLLSFDPGASIEKFSFANNKKLSQEELGDYCKELQKRGVEEWLLKALGRGIGIHHAGMNRAYRQV